MSEIYYCIFVAIATYLLGAIPNAYIIVKLTTGQNIMKHGTGNVGTMNTHRATGNKLTTIFVLLLELGKGMLAYLVTSIIAKKYELDMLSLLQIGAFWNILGHNYSVFLKFKGGKGLATAAGFLLLTNPLLVLFWFVGFAVTTAISKYMVLGQMVGTILLPIISAVLLPEYVRVIVPASALIAIAHLPRMKGVLTGKEPKMYYKERGAKKDKK